MVGMTVVGMIGVGVVFVVMLIGVVDVAWDTRGDLSKNFYYY